LTGSNPYKENNNNNNNKNKNTINALSEKRLKTIKIMMFYEKKNSRMIIKILESKLLKKISSFTQLESTHEAEQVS
jgi:hypothetical protein